MKKSLLILLFFIPIVFCAENVAVSSISVSEPARAPYDYECNLSEDELNNIKDFVINNFNISDASLINISYSYCYNYGDYYSIYVNLISRKNPEDINIKRISFSLSYNNEIDYNILMSGKADYFDYYLREKYYSYHVNQTDDEYYVMFSYNYDENYTLEIFKSDLVKYYDELSAEKYFQSDYDYPIIVFKSKNSELINIIPGFPAHISFYGDDLTFTFSGYNEGSYDLSAIALTDNCDIRDQYFYPEFNDECYGSYVDKERIYFSSSDYNENYSIYFSLYGVKGYKAEFSAGYWGDVSKERVQEFINNALSQYFPGYSFSPDLIDNYDSIVVRGFDFDESRFESMNKSKERENTNYYNQNTYVSIIEPHITIYSSSARIYSLDSKIMPPFYSQNTVITKDKVYSSIQIKENDAELAKIGLNEMLSGIVDLNEWNLNMSLRQYYYYYRGLDYAVMGQGISSSDSVMESSNLIPGVVRVSDVKTSAFDESKFNELEKEETVLELILNFFKSFFI